MHIGLIGLGKMGSNMRTRLREHNIEVTGFDRNPAVTDVPDIPALVAALPTPRIVWVMVPAGDITSSVVTELVGALDKGDLIIDGGNSRFSEDIRHAEEAAVKGIDYMDAGVSGGVWGLENGYGLMVGGTKESVERAMPIYDALRPEGPRNEGFVHVGEIGAGHYAKMVHNGIEYALMQAYAEGFQLLEETDSETLPADERFALDTAAIAEVWRHGSIVSSQLLDVIARALGEDTSLGDFSGVVADTGEGRWTVQTAIERAIPAMALTTALNARFRSRKQPNYADKLISAMRRGFGGHAEPKSKA